MARQEVGSSPSAFFFHQRFHPVLLIVLVEPQDRVLYPLACSPVSFLTILSTKGRKDGLLTVIFQPLLSVVQKNSSIRTTESFPGREG